MREYLLYMESARANSTFGRSTSNALVPNVVMGVGEIRKAVPSFLNPRDVLFIKKWYSS